ncbi:hypothetical protein [uncultured Helicobacter sp.]|uniref:hypothetical protein n=1 Tax=uncultured Helicobacter sp. TaxID=175537 RepID=UPI001C3BF75A|nr:hypothetical protein [Candidatus Helicobacter avicola]
MSDYKIEFVVKNTLFFLLFVVLAIIGITKVILPKIYAYKAQLTENRRAELIYNQTNADFIALSTQVRGFINDNRESFDKLYAQTPDDFELLELLREYFASVSLKQIAQSMESEISRTRYQLVGYVNNNLQLQEFMQKVSTLPYVIELSAPLEVREDRASHTLKVSLYLEILQSHYKPHALVVQENLAYKKQK